MNVGLFKSWEFCLPTQIRFGAGQFSAAPQVVSSYGRRALLVGYRPGSPLDEHYSQLVRDLQKSGVEVLEWFMSAGEPDVPAAVHAYEAAAQFRPEVVVGVGGGSVLDLAKFAAYQLRLGTSLDPAVLAAGKGGKEPAPTFSAALRTAHGGKTPFLILVPTTPGTGSEVTGVAVIRVEMPVSAASQTVPVKLAVNSPYCRADLAIVDPSLSQSCPPAVLAASLMDALGHSVEAVISRSANPVGLLFAGGAIGILSRHLPRLCSEGEDGDAWHDLCLAGLLGGLAVQARGVAVGHALAHALGAVLGMPHGLAVGLTLRPCLEFNLPETEDRFRHLWTDNRWLFAAFGEDWNFDIAAAVDHWTSAARRLALEYLPKSFDQHLVSTLVASAEAGGRLLLRLNPRRVNSEDLRELFLRILSQPSRG